MTIQGKLPVEDEEAFIGTLINLTVRKHFRDAWTLLSANVDPKHSQVFDAGVLLEQLSNEVGNIGELKEECLLKHRLNIQADLIARLLR